MRSNGNRGLWLGDRATAVLRFWENDNTATLTGDHIHFWPYGINGAHEDDGSDALYINRLSFKHSERMDFHRQEALQRRRIASNKRTISVII